MPTPHPDIDRWRDAVAAHPGGARLATSVPLHVLAREALALARFFEEHWKERRRNGAVVRRGLSSVAGPNGRLTARAGEEILSLLRAVQAAQARWQLTIDPTPRGDTMSRGRFLLGELTATLAWLLEGDAQLANLDAAHADDPATPDALALALDDYAALASAHRAALAGLGGFDAAHIDEARALARKLRALPDSPRERSGASREALVLRNRLAALLVERMGLVRAAARFVFRGQPEIVRKATSAYERRRRAASRRTRAKKTG